MRMFMIVSAFLAASVASASTVRAPQIEKNGHFMPVTALCFDTASDSLKSTIPAFECVRSNGDGCWETEAFQLVIPRTEERLVLVGYSADSPVYTWQNVTLALDYELSIVEMRGDSEVVVGSEPYTIPACADAPAAAQF